MTSAACPDDFKRAVERRSPTWMTTYDKPWEYLTPRLALDVRTGGKR